MENKKNLVTNSFIELGEEQDGKGKGRYFKSRFIESGIAHYDELGDILITKETLDKFIHTMVGCPVIINHKEVTDKNADKLRVGSISKVWYEPFDNWFYCEGVITDAQAIDLIKNQGWNVSCSYNFVSDNQKKTYHGKEIDQEFIDGEFLHLAIVENPRYEGANIVVNSLDIKKEEKEPMAVLEDLKSFILSVVNNEEEKEKEEKVVETENEEDEKEAENEDEEKEKEEKEEEKAENKCKNEAEEKEDEKTENEDDEEKVEEKEEIIKNEEEGKKEEAESKKVAKNSMDKVKAMVMGGNSKVSSRSLYTSQSERLELGNKF